jgi:hypothetical protein
MIDGFHLRVCTLSTFLEHHWFVTQGANEHSVVVVVAGPEPLGVVADHLGDEVPVYELHAHLAV